MNYWLLTTEYPPFFGGGISTYCYHTACMLSQKGYKVTVFISDKSIKRFSTENFQEARIIRFNPSLTKSHAYLGSITELSYEFANIVKYFIQEEGKPNIIEAQDYLGIGYFLLQFKYCLYNWCKDIPILITLHSPSFLYLEYNETAIYKKPNFWIGEMERFCIQTADMLISPSNYLVKELKERFTITNKNIHILVNPYEIESIQSNSQLTNNQLLNNSLTFYGKLSPQKGTFKILEQFKALWDKGFKESFTMIGGQDIVYYPAGKTMGVIVKKQFAPYIKKGLLELKNKILPSKLSEYLSEKLIIIIPSIVDNLPYVVLEMMRLGKIVIVSKQGGQAEIIIDEENGFIFDYTIPESFETTLKKVLSLLPEKRLTISQNAINTIINNYSYEKVYDLKNALIERLVLNNNRDLTHYPFIRPLTTDLQIKNQLALHKNTILSVVIPYYNLGKCIEQTINSILNSTYNNLEILIINDGSTDPLSINILNKYRNHPKITVFDNENRGLAQSRNFGALKAKGKFLAFLDADDCVASTYYEKAIHILNQYKNVHFIGAWTQYFEDSKAIWPTFNPEPPLILVYNSINSSALVYKTESFLKAGLNDERFKGIEDYDSVLNMLTNGLRGIAIPEILFNYRVRKNSMIKGVTKEIRKEYYNSILKKYSLLYSKYKKETLNIIALNEQPLNSDNATLDDIPFQHVPLINLIYKKIINYAKSHSKIKNILLTIKKKL